MTKKKIALYGLGTETKKAINKLSDEYDIIGLLDGYQTEGHLYGKPIISIETAVDARIERIIVVARPGSCKVIAKRISEFCRTNNVKLYDIRGKELLYENKARFSQKELESYFEKIVGTQDESGKIRLDLFKIRMSKIRKSNRYTDEIIVTDPYDIGYLFFAPIITDFVLWFAENVKKESFRNIWFFARDGYLIHKLYQMLNSEEPGQYVYTSRIAAVRLGVESEEDLRYVDSMKFSGTLEENLKKRFGIGIEEVVITSENSVLQYKDIIFEKSAQTRNGYKKYINTITSQNGDIAVFDFVAKGTTQCFMQRVAGNHLKGFYFLQLEPEYMKQKALDITPFYKAEELEESVIYDDYYILETILTSPEPSVIDFNQDGTPIFAEETRSKGDIECMTRIQKGIIDYFMEYTAICRESEQKINKRVDECLLSLIHNIEIANEAFKKMVVEDPFFNRMTNIAEVL